MYIIYRIWVYLQVTKGLFKCGCFSQTRQHMQSFVVALNNIKILINILILKLHITVCKYNRFVKHCVSFYTTSNLISNQEFKPTNNNNHPHKFNSSDEDTTFLFYLTFIYRGSPTETHSIIYERDRRTCFNTHHSLFTVLSE